MYTILFLQFLLCSEIEKNIETLGNLRREKWIADGKIRK